MSSEDNIVVESLHPEICEEVAAGLAQRSAARAASLAAPVWIIGPDTTTA